MKTLLYLLFYVYTTNCGTLKATTGVSEQQEIEYLEKQKGEIYSQINSAIHDTIQTLEKANDSDAKEGIAYMRELMTQIKKFSVTDLTMGEFTQNSSKDCSIETLYKTKPDSNTNFHNSEKRRHKKFEYIGNEKTKEAIEITGRGGQEGLHKLQSKKKKAELEARITLQKKLDAWKAQRDQQKKKIREYMALMKIIGQNRRFT